VLVQRRDFGGAPRQIVVRILAGVDRPAFEKRNELVEHAAVSGREHVAAVTNGSHR
jgi:hypothetical protein